MKINALLLSLLISFTLCAQKKSDFGFIGGGTTYFGEANPYRIISSPGYMVGAFYRYNLDTRYAFRLNVNYQTVRGSDANYENRNITQRSEVDFSTQIFSASATGEFSFLTFKTGENKVSNSSYMLAGLGYDLNFGVNIPFGFGYKVNLNKRLGLGCEAVFKKTFTDEIDGAINPAGNNLTINNDWYYYAGVYITYKFFKFAVDCPVYN